MTSRYERAPVARSTTTRSTLLSRNDPEHELIWHRKSEAERSAPPPRQRKRRHTRSGSRVTAKFAAVITDGRGARWAVERSHRMLAQRARWIIPFVAPGDAVHALLLYQANEGREAVPTLAGRVPSSELPYSFAITFPATRTHR